MKSAYVFKFLFVAALGALFATLIHADQEKWHRLGKDAFLTYQAGKFAQDMISPAPLAIVLVLIIFLALVLAASYEFCGYLGAKLLSTPGGKKPGEIA
jgi:hypothetical protein